MNLRFDILDVQSAARLRETPRKRGFEFLQKILKFTFNFF